MLEKCYETEVKDNINLYLVPTEEGEYLNMAFSDTGDYTYIRSAPDEDSDWVGKLYRDSAAQVLEYLDGWTKITVRFGGGICAGRCPDHREKRLRLRARRVREQIQ